MRWQFPIYLIGGKDNPEAWLKSKLDENEYLFVFTSSDSASQFIATGSTRGADSLIIIEVGRELFVRILEKLASRKGNIEWIAIDFRMPEEKRISIESTLASLS